MTLPKYYLGIESFLSYSEPRFIYQIFIEFSMITLVIYRRLHYKFDITIDRQHSADKIWNQKRKLLPYHKTLSMKRSKRTIFVKIKTFSLWIHIGTSNSGKYWSNFGTSLFKMYKGCAVWCCSLYRVIYTDRPISEPVER